MENECNHNCETCTQKCEISKDAPNAMSSIKKVIAVMSGKGGVGKSMIASALAVLTQRKGYNCAVLDADITGPSIPKSFGINDKAIGTEVGILPNLTCRSRIESGLCLIDKSGVPANKRGGEPCVVI